MAAVSAFSSLRCTRSPAVAVITPSVSGNRPVICSLWTTSRKQTGLKAYPSLSICMSRGAKMSPKAYASDETEGQGYDKESSERKPVSAEIATARVIGEETPVEDDEPAEIKDLKRALIDSFYGTDRGLKASSETRAEIIELINQMEAKNPTPAPTDALNLLNGKWILVYTSFSELFPLLAAGTLPLVKVKEISQTFDSDTFTVENSVQFAGPLATTSFSTNATFEIRSPKRVQVKFDQGVIGTPQLTDSIEFPENVEFLGQKIDLNPMKGVLNSVQNAASSVAKNISHRPPFKFPIRAERAQSWLLTTYLDKDLRISRGDGSSVFVLIKEGSPLLPPS